MKEIRDKKFRRLMKEAGLAKVELIKGEGYHYITSDDEVLSNKIAMMNSSSIYVCHFNHQTPEQWVEDIKRMLND